MGAPSGLEGRSRAGRHRRTGEPLIRRRDHSAERTRRRLPFPTPPLSALIGIAVLVLIGAGVIHLSGTGSAIPQEEVVAPVAETGAGSEPARQSAEAEEGGMGEGEAAQGGSGEGPAADAEQDDQAEQDKPSELAVHVSGAVASPGVVRLPAGSRVDDALGAAGGPTDEAELAAVNLARPLVDGEQIHVPVPGEEPPASSGPATGGDAPPAAADAPGGGGGDGTSGGAIDLNTASATELEELPGVGPAIAQRIIDHREQNGPFETVDQLEEVSGIGPATLEKLRDQATV